MTPFNLAQQLRVFASQLENTSPEEALKLYALSSQIGDVAQDVADLALDAANAGPITQELT